MKTDWSNKTGEFYLYRSTILSRRSFSKIRESIIVRVEDVRTRRFEYVPAHGFLRSCDSSAKCMLCLMITHFARDSDETPRLPETPGFNRVGRGRAKIMEEKKWREKGYRLAGRTRMASIESPRAETWTSRARARPVGRTIRLGTGRRLARGRGRRGRRGLRGRRPPSTGTRRWRPRGLRARPGRP